MRKQNVSQRELELLAIEVEKHKGILLSKFTSKVTKDSKQRVWEGITQKIEGTSQFPCRRMRRTDQLDVESRDLVVERERLDLERQRLDIEKERLKVQKNVGAMREKVFSGNRHIPQSKIVVAVTVLHNSCLTHNIPVPNNLEVRQVADQEVRNPVYDGRLHDGTRTRRHLIENRF